MVCGTLVVCAMRPAAPKPVFHPSVVVTSTRIGALSTLANGNVVQAAVSALGTTNAVHVDAKAGTCSLGWPRLGITIYYRGCWGSGASLQTIGGAACFNYATVTGTRWATNRGLHAGVNPYSVYPGVIFGSSRTQYYVPNSGDVIVGATGDRILLVHIVTKKVPGGGFIPEAMGVAVEDTRSASTAYDTRVGFDIDCLTRASALEQADGSAHAALLSPGSH
jgi:hypothetical protein